jgi:hypothetical protein
MTRGVVAAVPDAKHLEQLARALLRLPLIGAGDELRQRHVLGGAELGQQMVELIDVADGVATEQRPPPFAKFRGLDAGDLDLACLRPLQEPAKMQQRRLAGAGWSDDGDELAAVHREVRRLEDAHHGFALAEVPVHLREPQMRLTHTEGPRRGRTARRARRDRSLRARRG